MTLVVLAGVGLAVLSGRALLADRADARETPLAAPATPVTVATIALQDSHAVARVFSGQVEARQQSDLAFELAGVIRDVLAREGEVVRAGQALALLDTSLLEAERARLEARRQALVAEAELAQRTNTRQAELLERGFATDQTVDETSLALARLQAEIAALDAGLRVIDINLGKSALRAPFDGFVAARSADAGAVVAPGTPVLSLIEDTAPRFRVGLAPDLADRMAIGDAARVRIGEVEHTVTLAQRAPDIDPATRSRLAFFDFAGAAPAANETGELILQTEIVATGAWVPVSALRQGPRGTWSLLVVRDREPVPEAAEILHLAGDRAFVRGTFRDGDRFVPGGTHRIVPGQRVTVAEVAP